ncbi:RNA-binding S4 domain-containing protein [Micrococcoides hystricis]|uniref:RNA-binding S4 domain-containing protein n=1 Tax=Micrococcoides hystricis TaxID=1572761 RepID=A0ABV6PAF9_9MICC
MELEIEIKDESIRLGQLLKLAGVVDSGVDARDVIADAQVYVNGEVELRRGKQIRPGDEVSCPDAMSGQLATIRVLADQPED